LIWRQLAQRERGPDGIRRVAIDIDRQSKMLELLWQLRLDIGNRPVRADRATAVQKHPLATDEGPSRARVDAALRNFAAQKLNGVRDPASVMHDGLGAEMLQHPSQRTEPGAGHSESGTATLEGRLNLQAARRFNAVVEDNLQISSVRIEPDGTIIIVQGTPQPPSAANEWDKE
jgi:hypothetical protein